MSSTHMLVACKLGDWHAQLRSFRGTWSAVSNWDFVLCADGIHSPAAAGSTRGLVPREERENSGMATVAYALSL